MQKPIQFPTLKNRFKIAAGCPFSLARQAIAQEGTNLSLENPMEPAIYRKQAG